MPLEQTTDEDLFDEAVMVFNRALKKLLRTPAPDLSALTAKLDLVVRESARELTGGEACMAALVRDGRRLAG